MISTNYSRLLRSACIAGGLLVVFSGSAQEPDTGAERPAPTPQFDAAPANDPAPQSESYEDLSDLIRREQRARGDNDGASISVSGKQGGAVEVRNAEGEVIALYPPNHFVISGKVSSEAVHKLNESAEAMKQELDTKKKAEEEESKKDLELAKEAEATAKKEAEAKEAKWKEDLAAKSTPYLDKRTRENLNAVKIDAREIRKDGTYLYEGKEMKPVRLWNPKLNRYEMAIPVPPK